MVAVDIYGEQKIYTELKLESCSKSGVAGGGIGHYIVVLDTRYAHAGMLGDADTLYIYKIKKY